MADQAHALGQGDIRSDRAPGADLDPFGQGRRGVDQGGGVDGHQAAGSVAGVGTVTTMAMNSASAASLPSMKVSPRNL